MTSKRLQKLLKPFDKPEQLRDFRSKVSRLKKAGFINSDTNVRQALPHWIRKSGQRGGTFTLGELVDKFDDFLSGKEKPLYLDASKTETYRRRGYQLVKTTSGKMAVLYPHSADEKIRVVKGNVERSLPGGIRIVPIEQKFNNVPELLDYVKKYHPQETRAKFGARFYGGSSNIYHSTEDLAAYFATYKVISESIKHSDMKTQRDIIMNFELVEIASSNEWWKQRSANLVKIRAKRKTERKLWRKSRAKKRS